jgi:hypothetical protein
MKLQAGGAAKTRMPVVITSIVILLVILTAMVSWWVLPLEDPLKTARTGLLADVDTLRIAENSIFDFEESYVACGSMAAAQAAVEKKDASWRADPCWDQLGFRPVGEGTAFWVESAGTDFVAHGLGDFDGDGELVKALATRDDPAAIVTGDER